MKPVLAIVLLLSISVYSHAQIDEKIIRQSTDEFMEAMTAWADLKPFISIDFLKEKNVGDKKINLFMVDKYTIVKIENALATVEIDHGKGQFCTRIALAFVKDSDDQVRILPPDATADEKIIDPWKTRERLCDTK